MSNLIHPSPPNICPPRETDEECACIRYFIMALMDLQSKSLTPAKRFTCAFTSLSAWILANPSDECNTV